jgi:hypothetical protein
MKVIDTGQFGMTAAAETPATAAHATNAKNPNRTISLPRPLSVPALDHK